MRRVGAACICVCLCVLSLTGAAPAKLHANGRAVPRVVLRWPNSPVRHLKRLRDSSNTTPTFSANLRGGVAFAGNTLLTCPNNVSSRKLRAKNRRDSPLRSQDSTACVAGNNNDFNMKYVNVDSSDGHFDSSTATLTVPTNARVMRAFLYWGADLSEGVRRANTDPSGPNTAAADAAPANGNARRNRVARIRRCLPHATTRWAIRSGEPQTCASARARTRRSMPPRPSATASGRGSRAGTTSLVTLPGSRIRSARM